MKKFIAISSILIFFACQSTPATGEFGEKFDQKGSKDFKTAMTEYQAGKDSTFIIEGTIENVCQGEGCWITFKNDTTEFLVNTHEKFSMPKNSKGKTAVAKGKFVKTDEGEIEFQPTGVVIK